MAYHEFLLRLHVCIMMKLDLWNITSMPLKKHNLLPHVMPYIAIVGTTLLDLLDWHVMCTFH